MNRILAVGILWLAVGGAPLTAQMQQAQREQLEGRILREFVLQSARDLELSNEQGTALYNLLRTSAEEQRAIMREAMQLRTDLANAVRRSATPDAEFERLLAGLDSLRLRDQRQWDRDQQELAHLLSPRQRAGFALRWIRFQERIRDIVARRTREPRTPR